MSSQVFYRKWRPQSLGEVVGQEHVTHTLLNALKGERVSHAYLFCGPRGTGKTSTGRILAKAINCLTNGKGEPCNNCRICQAVTEGRALDVIEIDAASNTGVDNIRELVEKVNYSPHEGRYKVYIIDEVHMLSTSASNALLKTLEEPPPHAIFILATTETHKILPTILSRCQRFDFRRISQADVVSRLTHICKAEGITIVPEGLRLIARNSTGSLRDAANLLEQLTTYYGSNIELPQVQATLGISGDWRAKEMVKHIIASDISAGIKTIQNVNNDGLDLKQFNRDVVEYLRGLLLIKSNVAEAVDLSAEDINDLKTIAGKTSLAQILKIVRVFGELEFGFDNYSTLPLELALVECVLPALQEEAHPLPRPEPSTKMEKAAPAPPKAQAKPEAKPEASPVSPVVEKPRVTPVERISEKAEAKPAIEKPEAKMTPASEPVPAGSGREFDKLQNWKMVLDALPANLKRTNTAALLKSYGIEPKNIEGNIVTLSFKYKPLKENVEKPEHLRVTEQIVSHILGRPCQVRCIVETSEDHIVQHLIKMGAKVINVEENKNL